jgi:CheY-like chemotaxis protein
MQPINPKHEESTPDVGPKVERVENPVVGSHPLVTTQANLPSHAAVRALAEDILHSLKYSFTAAAVAPEAQVQGRADTLFREFLARRKPEAKQAYRMHAEALLNTNSLLRERTFGRYAHLDLSAYRRVGADQAHNLVPALRLDGPKLMNALKQSEQNEARFTQLPPSFFTADEEAGLSGRLKLKPLPQQSHQAVAPVKYTKVGLYLSSVHCIEETDEIGSDHIALGGSYTSADGRTTTQVREFSVSKDFDEGETVHYGGKLFAEWNILAGKQWPMAYSAMVVMAEKDDGGFAEFLQKLWGLVSDAVKSAVGKAAGTAIGTAIGGAFGGLGAVLGAAIGFILGALVDWVISWFNNVDDLIAMKPLTLWLHGATASYYASTGLATGSPKQFKVDFIGDGGHYRAWFYYRIW